MYKIKAFLDNHIYDLEQASEKSANYWPYFWLLYPMQTWPAKILRVGFYAILGLSVLTTLFMSGISFSSESIREFGWLVNILTVVTVSLPGILLAMVFHWLARKLDTPANTAEKKQ